MKRCSKSGHSTEKMHYHGYQSPIADNAICEFGGEPANTLSKTKRPE